MEFVGAALGDGVDLQSRRPAVFGVIAGLHHFEFADSGPAEFRRYTGAADLHGRNAVDLEIAIAGSAGRGWSTAKTQGDASIIVECKQKIGAGYRKVLNRLRAQREGLLAAGHLKRCRIPCAGWALMPPAYSLLRGVRVFPVRCPVLRGQTVSVSRVRHLEARAALEYLYGNANDAGSENDRPLSNWPDEGKEPL